MGLAVGSAPGLGRAVPSRGSLAISVEPQCALMGTPYRLVISGLAPGEQVTLKARTTDRKGRSWESSAVFAASGRGRES